MKKIVVLHTSFVSVEDLKSLFSEIIPEARVYNIVDDSLLPEVIKNDGVTPLVVRRLCLYALQAEAIGADLIFNQCSSVGEAFDTASQLVQVPTLKVDQAMAEAAAAYGKKITVIATVKTTLGPSSRLIESAARKLGCTIDLNQCLVEGAFEALTQEHNKEKHNMLVLDAVKRNANSSDSIVLAQGSMITLLPMLNDIRTPILTSPRMGVERARQMLGYES